MQVSLTNNILIVINCMLVTEEGIWKLSTRVASQNNFGKLICAGSFAGLTVVAVDSVCPLILSTQATKECGSLVVLGML